MFYVKFIRNDDLPDEEYYYHTFQDAKTHFELFRDDDSEMYFEIQILSEDELVLDKMIFER